MAQIFFKMSVKCKKNCYPWTPPWPTSPGPRISKPKSPLASPKPETCVKEQDKVDFFLYETSGGVLLNPQILCVYKCKLTEV